MPAYITASYVTDNILSEDEGIQDVRDLPGGWLVDEWQPFEEAEMGSLVDALHPRIARILQNDKEELASVVHIKGFWRDLICLSWTYRTFHPKEIIEKNIPTLLARADVVEVLPTQKAEFVNLDNGASILRIEVLFKISNPAATCLGIFKFVRLLNGDIKLFTVTTLLVELDCAPWKDCVNTRDVTADLPRRIEVLVIGGGHAGLSIGAYLSAMDLDFAIIDKEKQVGDSWSNRYESATIHTTRLASGLPFLDIPEDYPEYVSVKQMASYYQNYARQFNLPIYQSTIAEKATFAEDKKEWTVKTSRGVVFTKVLVFAVGIGGSFPVRPDWSKEEKKFEGEQLHSAEYKNAKGWKGKKVLVIGTSSTGMDVALDCANLGIDTTIVQRGATRIYPPGHTEIQLKGLFNDTRTVAESDQIACEDPMALQHPLCTLSFRDLAKSTDPEWYTGLAKAGFRGIHEGPIQNQDVIHCGKHYPDVGAGAAIISGAIKVKSDSEVVNIEPTGLAFANGTHLDADVIVYCTGFKKDTRQVIADIIGRSHKLELIWGLDEEGEIRGAYGPTSGHDRIFSIGGGFLWMRHYSKYLALQIAAILAGVRPEPVCRGDNV